MAGVRSRRGIYEYRSSDEVVTGQPPGFTFTRFLKMRRTGNLSAGPDWKSGWALASIGESTKAQNRNSPANVRLPPATEISDLFGIASGNAVRQMT
jgi:hypothetical protein